MTYRARRAVAATAIALAFTMAPAFSAGEGWSRWAKARGYVAVDAETLEILRGLEPDRPSWTGCRVEFGPKTTVICRDGHVVQWGSP